MSAPDKFLTDLAGLTQADSIQIEWRGYFQEASRFEVSIGRLDETKPHRWAQGYGTGATVDEAMANARSDYAVATAKDAA